MLASRLLRARPLARPLALAAASTCVASVYVNQETECASWLSSKPKVHLKYFDVQGVAETIRHTMALGGIEWTESMYAVDFSKIKEGPTVASPQFAKAKADGELAANMDRGPVIIVDGATLGQSKTIEKYLARRCGVMGGSELEAAYIDAITEHIRDIKDKYQKAKGVPEDKEKFFAETMPEFMGKLEKAVALTTGTGPPLVGKSLSLADATLYVFIVDFFDDKAKAKASIEGCPNLKASIEAVGSHSGVAKYRESRKSKST